MTRGGDAILALDLGTSALKAMVFDLGGNVVARAVARYPTHHPQPGWAEQDAEEWWQAVVAAVRELGDAARVPLLAIGLASQREGVVPVDRAGRPLARCITWMDRRAQPEAEELGLTFPDLHQRTGMLPDAMFTAAKTLWLRRHQAEVLEAAALLLQPRDYLYYRLTGMPVTDPSLASRTMLYDLRRADWADDLLDAAGVSRAQLPPLHASVSTPARLSAAAAAALGLEAGVPVAVGGGDRPCEVLGVGAADGRPMESSGTATNVSLPAALGQMIPERILASAHVLPERVVLEQGIGPAGPAMDWVLSLVGGDEALLEEAAADDRPSGLFLLPHFDGARAPWWNTRARAVWAGFTGTHTRRDMVRSVLEAVAFETRGCLEALERAGHRVREVVLSGGGARSKAWAALKANIWGRPVSVPRVPDGAALGAMIVAAAAVQALDLGEAAALNPPVERIEPDPSAVERYAAAYDAYRSLYARVNPT